MKKYLTALALVPLAFTGCATIISGANQTMNIKAVNRATDQIVPGAMCIVKGNNATYPMSSNPGVISVSRKSGVLDVQCTKRGYHTSVQAVTSSINGWTALNLLGFPIVGFVVDAVTGSLNKYPSSVTVVMQPK